MIKVNSKVFIKGLCMNINFGTGDTPVSECLSIECVRNKIMIVEGLYYRNQFSIWNINEDKTGKSKAKYAKCLWYNTRNELQSELINLELLTEL